MTRLATLSDLVDAVGDGARVGIGGLLNERRPVAALGALSRAGRTGLEIVTLTGSIETDFAVGVGLARRVRSSFVSLGLYGLAPEFTAARQAGTIDAPIETEMTIVAGLQAAIAGIGFRPMRAWHGTDILSARPDILPVTCPYTGEVLVAFPALELDATIVHAPFADQTGNIVLTTDRSVDVELLRAAATRIVTVERILPESEFARVPGHLVHAIDVDLLIEHPRGALPTGCQPLYGPDWIAFEHYATDETARPAFLQTYLQQPTAVGP